MLYVLGANDAKKWNEIVKSFQDYDVYWLNGYTKAFQLHGDGEPLLFYYEQENLRGINVVMKRDIATAPQLYGKLEKGELFDFATPYGYGGWLIEGTGSLSPLFSAYEAWCKEHNIISEFVRFHPILRNHCFCQSSYEVIPLGQTVALDISSPETIWANLTSQNRNKIRKAEKNGIKIKYGNSKELYKTFRVIYDATMDRDNVDKYYYFAPEFYESINDELGQNAVVFYAQLKDKIIGSSIMLYANGKLNYHLSGSVDEYRNLAPINLLLYKAALWGCEQGCQTFHLGGGVGSCADSLFKFKKSFYRKDDLPRYNIGKKIFDKQKYKELLMTRGEIESNFFPKYRA